jgi:hypothetical protein
LGIAGTNEKVESQDKSRWIEDKDSIKYRENRRRGR